MALKPSIISRRHSTNKVQSHSPAGGVMRCYRSQTAHVRARTDLPERAGDGSRGLFGGIGYIGHGREKRFGTGS